MSSKNKLTLVGGILIIIVSVISIIVNASKYEKLQGADQLISGVTYAVNAKKIQRLDDGIPLSALKDIPIPNISNYTGKFDLYCYTMDEDQILILAASTGKQSLTRLNGRMQAIERDASATWDGHVQRLEADNHNTYNAHILWLEPAGVLSMIFDKLMLSVGILMILFAFAKTYVDKQSQLRKSNIVRLRGMPGGGITFRNPNYF
ncbi:MAG: hypothetical protein FWH26_02010 [Oscillospiraceae bacterium]|nr:hypothetical protein [Oscillospiraceae bacterium]